MRRVCLVVVCFCLIGCATVGSKIDADKVSQIKEGITTKQEVIELLGNPLTVSLTADSKTMMMYQYVKASNRAVNFVPVVGTLSGGVDMDQQILQILIDENDVVEKYVFNDFSSAINSGLMNTR